VGTEWAGFIWPLLTHFIIINVPFYVFMYREFFNFVDWFTALRFTAAIALLAARCI
jgi:hypothetical protein